MDIQLNKTDFNYPFSDPASCPMARALQRSGFRNVLAGTLGATARVDENDVTVWVAGVYLNGAKIDHPAMGFGPNEYNRIQQAFEENPNTRAVISVTNNN